jgi:hypothetical protein
MLAARVRSWIAAAVATGLAAGMLAGCSSQSHQEALGPPAQQQYFDALKLGNAAEASQIWLRMTPEERLKFERGQDIRPSVVPQQVQRAIAEHYANQEDDEGDSAPKQIELGPHGGGLQDLPAYLQQYGGSSGGAPQSAPVAPANH